MELLTDGRALLIAGCKATDLGCYEAVDVAETYSPESGVWTTTAPMMAARFGHASARLGDGRVIVAGGCPTSSANCGSDMLSSTEVFDPSSNSWAASATLGTKRTFLAAARLNDGRALFTGGATTNGTPVATAQIFDGASWASVSNLVKVRFAHAMGTLPGGQVLVVGGCSDAGCGQLQAETEYFDPDSNTFLPGPAISPGVSALTVTPTSLGALLIAGGQDQFGSAAKNTSVFDPGAWNLTGAPGMIGARMAHAASRLPDGRVMVTGGISNGQALDTTELFVPDVLDDPTADAATGGAAGVAGGGGAGGVLAGGGGNSGADAGAQYGGGSSSGGCFCALSETPSGRSTIWAILLGFGACVARRGSRSRAGVVRASG